MKMFRSLIALVLLIGLALPGCVFGQSQQDETFLYTDPTNASYEELWKKIAELERRLQAIEEEMPEPLDSLEKLRLLADEIIEKRKQRWRDDVLRYTAYNNVGGYGLTDKLSSLGTVAHYYEDEHTIVLIANTETQPTWRFHLGAGRFSVSDREVRNAYNEAGQGIYSRALDWFDMRIILEDLRPKIVIQFLISGYEVGTWYDYTFTLLGE